MRGSALKLPGFADDLTLQAISAETSKARRKFPRNRRLLAAAMEELGELAKALLQGKDKDEIDKEALQVAAMMVRIIEEGDADFDNLTEEEKQA